MDRDGAVKLLEAALAEDVARYVMVSSVGAESPPDGDDVFSAYLRAKAEADAAVMQSTIAWTIVRPGRLADGPATDRVELTTTPERGEITRADRPRSSPRLLTNRPSPDWFCTRTADRSVADALAALTA